ncbi:hypothetical protein GCM10009831_22050 [Dietzia cercidiphylli]|uniref:Uncharacterized protein n=1 Tax=Dietzia cercidiphylli TaxID=498199 RepID=A0ABN2IUE4_9ACTN
MSTTHGAKTSVRTTAGAAVASFDGPAPAREVASVDKGPGQAQGGGVDHRVRRKSGDVPVVQDDPGVGAHHDSGRESSGGA